MKQKTNNSFIQKGFTLVELMVIAPIIIIAITGTIALLVNLIAENVIANEESAMTAEIQSALDEIEESLSSADQFLNSGDELTASDATRSSSYPPGPPSTGNPFAGMNIIGETYDQSAEGSTIIPAYSQNPNGCGSARSSNPIIKTNTVYFAQRVNSSKTELKRRILTDPSRDPCEASIFPPSCESISPQPTSGCTKDDVLAKDVVRFRVKYFDESGSETSNRANATAAEVNLVIRRSVAGKSVVSEGTRRFALLNK